MNTLTLKYVDALSSFKEKVAGKDEAKQEAFNTVFEQLQREPLPLSYVTKLFGLSTQEFVELVTSIQPHLLSRLVLLNTVVEKTIDVKAL